MAKNTKPATDALEILHGRFYEGKPSKIRDLEDARANEEIARNIFQLRTAAGLTQSWLALVLSGGPRRRSRVWGIKLRSVLCRSLWCFDGVKMFSWQVCRIPSLAVEVLWNEPFTGKTEPRP